jgi:hypothetical protein
MSPGLTASRFEPAPRGWRSAHNCRNNPILSDSHGKASIDLAQPHAPSDILLVQIVFSPKSGFDPETPKPLGSIITSVADPAAAKRRRDGFRFRTPVTPPHGPTRDGANPPFPRAPRSRSPSSPRSRARGRRRRH